MRFKIGILVFLLQMFGLQALPERVRIDISPTVGQGEWCSVIIRDYAAQEGFDARFQVRLLDSARKELLKKDTFLLTGSFGLPIQALVMGMYIEWLPGIYTVEISNLKTGWTTEKEFTLEDIDYPQANLRLDRTLTNLVTRPDPRKETDAAEFWRVINRYEAFSTENFPLFLLPVRDEFRLSSPFGVRRTYQYSTGRSSISFHWGMDLAAPEGTALYAPASGTVLLAKERVVSGNTVMIEHLPGVISIYYHMQSLSVQTGQVLKAGDTLGTLGTTGLSTGPHLHWEVRIHGIPISPRLLLEKPLLDIPE